MTLMAYLLSILGLFANFSLQATHMELKDPLADMTNKQQNIIRVSTKQRIGSSKSDKKIFNYRKFVLHKNQCNKQNIPYDISSERFFLILIDKAIANNSHKGKELRILAYYIANNNIQFRSADQSQDFVGYVVDHYRTNIWAPRVVSKLLAEGANPNNINPETGLRPLHVAIYQQHDELVEPLVHGGADVNMPTINGQTPLHFACITGSYKMAKYLIDNGADVDARDNHLATPMHFAVGRSLSKDMPSHLQFPNQRVGKLKSNKYWSQIDARKKLIDVLLENNADLEPIDSDKNTPYQIACRELHFSLASYLERKKAKDQE